MLEAESFFGATTDIASVTPDEVQLMDVSPRQIVSVGTALIPFLEHDDANRALMGANMQKQAVPLRARRGAVHRHRHRGPRRPRRGRPHPGHRRRRRRRGQRRLDHRHLRRGRQAGSTACRSSAARNQDTCINHRVRVSEGEKVVKGTILADGPSTDHGELALGKNLLVALMPWEGYNFEDAIILSASAW